MPDDLRLIDRLCDKFESVWRSGSRPSMDSYLKQVPSFERRRLFNELLALELDYLRDQGENPGEQEYADRYAEFAATIEQAFRHNSQPPTQGTTGRRHDTDAPATVQPDVVEELPGYEVLDELGRGAMGVVHRARQLDLDRVVAVKMLLAGRYANAKELARFCNEAEAVAKLQHPNIVQIFDVGQQEDRPFLALEFVEGGTLKDRISGQPQSPRAAAEMCETIARATHVAHEHGIIHRDLKPGNILLTKDGTPKITDFGLAKQLEASADNTRTGELIGTPSYMSPEQAAWKKESIGPTSDVYSLGAILYVMLTGRPPFLAETVWDTVTQVIADDPVPPTRLQTKVPRDLETICLKCLSKEPRSRYQSAEELADDLARWRSGQPIRARPTGLAERVVKWSRRHPAAAALLAVATCSLAIVLTLIAVHNYRLQLALGATSRAQQATEREHQTALANAKVAEDNHLLARQAVYDCFVISTTNPTLKQPGMQPVREVLLKSALQYYRGFAEQRGDDPQLQRELAENQRMIGEIEELIGSKEAAIAAFEEAARMWDRVIAREPSTPEWLFQRGRVLHDAGRARLSLGETPEAIASFELAVDAYSKLVELAPDDRRYLGALATCSSSFADLLRLQGNYQEAIDRFGQTREVFQRFVDLSPKNYGYRRNVGLVDSNVGLIWYELGRPDDALKSFESARDVFAALSRDQEGKDLATERELATSHGMIATLHERENRLQQALAAREDQRAIAQRLAEQNPRVTQFQHDLAMLNSSLSNVYSKQGNPDEALAHAEQAIALHQKLTAAEPRVADYQLELANAYQTLSGLQASRDDRDAAKQAVRQAIDIQQALLETQTGYPRPKEELAGSYEQLADLLATEDPRAAATALQTAASLLIELASEHVDVPRYQTEAARLTSRFEALPSELP